MEKIMNVKFHVTEKCNFACKYCFSGHGLKGKTLTPAQACDLITKLTAAGCKRLSFIGGEPTLYVGLPSLIKHAKSLGLETTVVSNGTGLTDDFLSEVESCLDVVCLSVDTLCAESLCAIGRTCNKQTIDKHFYYMLVNKLKEKPMRLKINTVVNLVNYMENLTAFINYAEPTRWRIFRVLPVTPLACKFAVSTEMFSNFRNRHRATLSPLVDADFVDDAIASAQYILIDPVGRIFINDLHKHIYSDSILNIGVDNALNQIYSTTISA